MNTAVIYARVSSREQEREGYSIPAQQKLLREYAKQKGLRILAEFTDIETAIRPQLRRAGAVLRTMCLGREW
jgi:DNA invertase Pin-like site-specific DNA recombinase